MRRLILLVWILNVVCLPSMALASDGDLRKELEELKERVKKLEAQLEEKEQGQKEEIGTRGAELEAIKKGLEERFGTLAIHGSVVGYWQGANEPEIGGEEFRSSNGAGYTADLELTFRPTERGEFFMRLHAGEGDGADKDLKSAGALFANLNTLDDDNPEGQFMDLLEAFYTQRFLEGKGYVSIGKTHSAVFIDNNAYANDEKTQFVGKPFVNNPVLNSEDEYAPLVAIGVSPLENLSLVGLVISSSHGGDKSVWNNVQDQPFLAAQLTFSPKIGDRPGHYRVYAWDATYDHPDLTDPDTEKPGWGLGLSLEQEISEQAGVFARFAYNNKEVYPVEWFWSAGTHLKGLLHGRDEDELGVGIAGLIANSNLNKATADTGFLLTGDNEGTEYHLEAYYRIRISEYLSVTPDVQYVIDPLGNSHNDDVFAAMLRAHLSF
jgi:carbohydrate-selective porin OprB